MAIVVKTVRKNGKEYKYRYYQRSYRVGKKVKTHAVFLGAVGLSVDLVGAAVRGRRKGSNPRNSESYSSIRAKAVWRNELREIDRKYRGQERNEMLRQKWHEWKAEQGHLVEVPKHTLRSETLKTIKEIEAREDKGKREAELRAGLAELQARIDASRNAPDVSPPAPEPPSSPVDSSARE